MKGRKDEAFTRIDAVIQAVPAGAEAMTVKAQWLLTDGRIAEADAMAQAAVKANPGLASAHLVLGQAQAAAGDRPAGRRGRGIQGGVAPESPGGDGTGRTLTAEPHRRQHTSRGGICPRSRSKPADERSAARYCWSADSSPDTI